MSDASRKSWCALPPGIAVCNCPFGQCMAEKRAEEIADLGTMGAYGLTKEEIAEEMQRKWGSAR